MADVTPPHDVEATRRDILDELAPLVDELMAGPVWGRALVRVGRRDDGSLRVENIDVEDIVGDERLLDDALGGPAIRPLLPVLARACDALCDTFDVDVDDVEGGTLLRQPDGALRFLPGLVHAPSDAFERLRDACLPAALARQDDLARRGVGERFDVDLERGLIVFPSGNTTITLRATLLGSWARASHTWAWVWANPSLDEHQKAPARALCDAVVDRTMWEVSTPQFACDEGTVWALAAVVTEGSGAIGLYRAPHPGGSVFLVLHET